MSRGFPAKSVLDVLFVAYGGGHIQMVMPVALSMRDQGYRVAIMALTTALSVVERSDIDYFTYADLPQMADHSLIELGERLASTPGTNSTLPLAETKAYMALNHHDLALQCGLQRAEEIWSQSGRQAFFPIHLMKEVIGSIGPKLVVATNSPRSERAAISAASLLGIPAVAMVDMFALQEVKWLAKPDYGRKLLVLNAAVAKTMISHGRPPQDVAVTGNPAFDGLRDPSVIAMGNELRTNRGWGQDGRKVLLYASAPEPEVHPFSGQKGNTTLPGRVEEYLRNLVSKDDRYDLVIRRHPSEFPDVVIAPHVFHSPGSDDVSHVIHAADLVLVLVSTVGLQAYIAGKPVVTVSGSVFEQDAPYADYGMAKTAKDVDQIEEVVRSSLENLKQ